MFKLTEVKVTLKEVTGKGMQKCILQKWYSHWWKCVTVLGIYFTGHEVTWAQVHVFCFRTSKVVDSWFS